MADSPDTLTIADRALLAAQRGWAGDADERFWACFAPEWRQVLRAGWHDASRPGPEESRQALRLEHEAQARPDLGRVHPTWWLRALKDETPAVQRAVLASAPEAMRAALRGNLGLTDEALGTDRTPDPQALRAATARGAERLVGDLPERDDPPVIAALTRGDSQEALRLIPLVGLAKWACSGLDLADLNDRDQADLEHFRRVLAGHAPSFAAQAARDVARHGQARRPAEVSLGLLTFARLLHVVEPYRVRWALQHLPYSFAKSLRNLMRPPERHDAPLLAWESEILAAARDRRRAVVERTQGTGGPP